MLKMADDRPLYMLALSAMLTSLLAAAASACPFCFGSQQLTLRERIETPDASLLVEWQTGEPGNINTQVPASTTFKVLKVWRGEMTLGAPLTTDHYYEGQPGERYLLVGNLREEVIVWDRAIALTPAGLEYVTHLPSSESSITQRLRYAFEHLESVDTTIANDAFDVLAGAKYEDIAAAREYLNAAKLRQWVHDPDTLVMRLGVYGMLLGLAGTNDDIPQLHRRIFDDDPARPIRVGIDGVMGGYLLLAGADGLDKLDAAYLEDANATPDNLIAVTSALRFMWEYGEGLISKDRLRQSMRLALDHEETQELAIVDLARWQDWTVTARIVELHHSDPHRSLQRRIVGFLAVAADTPADGLNDADLAAVSLAKATLETIRQDDPALWRNAQRGLIHR